MNLLCPNCQKPLTVPEQYAGQPMRCPLCQGTFTVPALPPTSVPPPPLPPEPQLAPSGAPDVYGLQGAPPAPPPSAPPPTPNFNLSGAPPGPSPVTGAPPPPPPSGPPPAYGEEQPSYPTTPIPEGYQRRYTSWFSPKVLMYFAPVAVFLICALTLFAWTGVYPGGVFSASQNAWQAAFPWPFGWSQDPDVFKTHPPFPKGYEPGWNFLLIFYLLLLFPTFVVTAGCLLLAFVPLAKLPPAAHQVLPWRWGIVAALNLILLLFLLLQMVLGFSLENNYIAAADKVVAARAQAREGGVSSTEEQRADAIDRGLARQAVSRTYALDLVVILSILAVLAAGLMFWLNRRDGRPVPRIDVLW